MLPSIIVLVIISGILMLILDRKFAALPFFMASCYVTLAQRIIIAGLDFTIIRILILFGILRVIIRQKESRFIKNELDIAMVVWVIVMVVTGSILSGMEGFINRMGNATDALGVYFIIRFLLATPEDIISLIKGMAIIILPLGLLMLIEMKTGRNFFSIFGGVPEFTVVRHGKLRCQGAFAHPILAGTAGAVSFPFMLYFLLTKTSLRTGVIGILSSLAMVVTSNSSGPIMTLFFGMVGLFFWKWRFKMKTVRIFIVVSLILLNFFMKSPVWYLISKIDLTGSSTGWHRSELINSALIHLKEWWLVGTNYTRHWMPTGVSWSPNHTDITNHYLHFGVIGGLPTMLCFIMIIVKGFRLIGILIRNENLEKEVHFLCWTAGSILFAHVMTFFSVSYFDQTNVFLYTLFAIIGALFNCYNYPRNIMVEKEKESFDFISLST